MTQALETPIVENTIRRQISFNFSSHSSVNCFLLMYLVLVHEFLHTGMSTYDLLFAPHMQSVDPQGKEIMCQF